MKAFGGLFACAIALLVAGCAEVTVRKIPTATQYQSWTDDDQRRADAIEGFRFYLPRPFVNVFESFPIHSEVYLANGTVSPDGRYIVIRKVRSDSPLANYFASELVGLEVPVSVVLPPQEQKQRSSFQQQSGTDASPAQAAADALKVKVLSGVENPQSPTLTGAGEPKPAKPEEKTGIERRGVTNDNSAFAYQPMRGNLDIAYLPDFEEQYAVSSKARLGNAEFELNLGQGWSLQGFNSTVDNSAINGRILDLIDTASQLAKTAAEGALAGVTGGASLLTGAAKQGASGFIAQSGSGASEVPGADVSIKVTIVYYAAKGLYPVIKPRELKSVQQSTAASNTVVLDVTGAVAGSVVANDLSPAALRAAKEAVQAPGGFVTTPRYPYMYISFNTFRIMAVEAIDPTGKPFGALPDKTGTSGDPGGVRTSDVRPPVVGGNAGSDGEPDEPKEGLNNLQSLLAIRGTGNPLSFGSQDGQTTYKIIDYRPEGLPAKGKVLSELQLCVAATGAGAAALATPAGQKAFVSDLGNALTATEPVVNLTEDDKAKIKAVAGTSSKACFPESSDSRDAKPPVGPVPVPPVIPTPEHLAASTVTWESRPEDQRKKLQTALCVKADGLWGPRTYRAAVDWGVHQRKTPTDGRFMDDQMVNDLIAQADDAVALAEFCKDESVRQDAEAPLPDAEIAKKFESVVLTGLNGTTIKVTSANSLTSRIVVKVSIDTTATREIPELSLKTNLISAAGLPYRFAQGLLEISNLSEVKAKMLLP